MARLWSHCRLVGLTGPHSGHNGLPVVVTGRDPFTGRFCVESLDDSKAYTARGENLEVVPTNAKVSIAVGINDIACNPLMWYFFPPDSVETALRVECIERAERSGRSTLQFTLSAPPGTIDAILDDGDHWTSIKIMIAGNIIRLDDNGELYIPCDRLWELVGPGRKAPPTELADVTPARFWIDHCSAVIAQSIARLLGNWAVYSSPDVISLGLDDDDKDLLRSIVDRLDCWGSNHPCRPPWWARALCE